MVAPATTETASTTVYAGETVTVSELIAAGNTAMYDVDSILCSAGTVGWSGLETDTDATVAVSAANVASPITCTITNSAERGTIVVVKNTAGGDGTFDFTGNWAGAGDFQLTTIGGTTTATYNDVLVPKQGGYSVVESDPTPAFDGTNVTCTDNDGDRVRLPVGRAAKPLTGSIDLDDDETVTCTFTNTKRATIVIVKDAQPDSAQDFGFTTTGLATSAVHARRRRQRRQRHVEHVHVRARPGRWHLHRRGGFDVRLDAQPQLVVHERRLVQRQHGDDRAGCRRDRDLHVRQHRQPGWA